MANTVLYVNTNYERNQDIPTTKRYIDIE